MKLVVEAVIVGLIVVLIGTAVTFVVSKITAVDLPPTCRVWKKNYTMEIALFLTGVVTHLAFEFVMVILGTVKMVSPVKKFI